MDWQVCVPGLGTTRSRCQTIRVLAGPGTYTCQTISKILKIAICSGPATSTVLEISKARSWQIVPCFLVQQIVQGSWKTGCVVHAGYGTACARNSCVVHQVASCKKQKTARAPHVSLLRVWKTRRAACEREREREREGEQQKEREMIACLRILRVMMLRGCSRVSKWICRLRLFRAVCLLCWLVFGSRLTLSIAS